MFRLWFGVVSHQIFLRHLGSSSTDVFSSYQDGIFMFGEGIRYPMTPLSVG